MIEWIEALIYFTLAVFGWITGSFIYGFIHHEWTYNQIIENMRKMVKKEDNSFSMEETKDGITLIITVQPENW
jgi:hypothetical protein